MKIIKMPYGLSKENMTKIQSVLADFVEIDEAVLYGSRAKGNYKSGSDIDLALKGERLNLHILNTISLALDDLFLPWIFDLVIHHHIRDSALIDHIQRVGQVVYRRAGR